MGTHSRLFSLTYSRTSCRITSNTSTPPYIYIGGSPICNIRLADDIDLMGDSENELQGLTTRLDERARVGSILSKDGTSTKEIKLRVAVAMSAMSRLDTIWKSRNISLQTKLKLYRALAVSILLYGCGSWTLTAETERRIQNKQTPLLESKSPCWQQ